MIVGIGVVDLLHRVGIGLGASFVIQCLRVAVKGGDGRQIRLLARGGGTVGGLCFVNFVQATLDVVGIGLVPELVPQAHRDAPVGHHTARIVDGNLLKFFFCLFVPEGVQ